jgi:1-acyl-sn-glycerol-3-phosphate acyltransferase
MKVEIPERQGANLPHVSVGVMKVFAAYSRHYLLRHFHAMRILRSGMPASGGKQPLVIFLNHASWWDPLVSLLLSREFFANRQSFAPIDGAMLERYSVFRKLGFFGIEPNTARGARTFLRTSRAILDSSERALWITPQGRFVDVRERPLQIQEGLGALACRESGALFVPLAIEYTFWTEPRPEILVAFGEPIAPCDEVERTAAHWTRVLSEALEATQEELAARSCRRDFGEWLTISRGKSGVNAMFDAWQRIRAGLRGEKFIADHQAEVGR